MDENQDQALNGEGENPQEATPAPEQTPEEVPQSPEVETETTDTETEESPKKGYQSRVRELNTRAKLAEEQVQSLQQKIAEITGSIDPSYQGNYTPQVAPGEEMTPEQYQRHVMQAADSLVTLKLKQSEAIGRIREESKDAVRKYPELDPESDSFNKDLSNSISEAVEAHVRANPYSASVGKFVEKLMKPYKGAIETEVGKASENIAKQVSQAALRPTAVTKKEKAANEKSIAELEQELGIVHS